MNTGIETKRPLKIEYQTVQGGKKALPFDIAKEKGQTYKKGNIITRDEFGALQIYENQLEFEKYHGELNKSCNGDNTTFVTEYLDYVFTQSLMASEPCENYNRVVKRQNGDPKVTKITKLTIEKLDKETTEDRQEEIYDEIAKLEDEIIIKYDQYGTYLDIVLASFEGTESQRGFVTKDGKKIDFDERLYKILPAAYQERLKFNALKSMVIQDSELGN